MKRILIWGTTVLLGLLLILFAVGLIMIKSLQDPDYLVRQIESRFNCRAQIVNAELDLFASPAGLGLTGVSLAERDEHADKGTKLSDRPQMTSSTASINHVLLEFKPWPLLLRKFVLVNMVFESPTIEMVVYEDGTSSFDRILRPPSPGGTQPSAGGDAAGGAAPSMRLLKASELPISVVHGKLEIDNATVSATIEKSKTVVQIKKGLIECTNIDIDPQNLSEHNSADLEFSAWVGVFSFERDTTYMDIKMEGNGAVQPFNPSTAELDPSLSAQVTVRKDSHFTTWPMIDDMEELIANLENYGVDLDSVRFRGEFSEDTKTEFNATRQTFKMVSDFMIPIDDNFLVVERGSWIHTSENDHEFDVTFIASERLTRKAEAEIDKFIKENAGEAFSQYKDELIRTVKKGDFLVLEFKSKGSFEDPDVSAENPLGDPSQILNNPELLKTITDGLSDDVTKTLESLFGK